MDSLTKMKQQREKSKGKADEKLAKANQTIATQQHRFGRLSDRFSELMAQLGFAGELSMVETGETSCPFKVTDTLQIINVSSTYLLEQDSNNNAGKPSL